MPASIKLTRQERFPNLGDWMPLETGKTVIGRVDKVTERGLVVLLSDENTGIVHASASLSIETMMERFSSGTQVHVSIGVPDENGSYALTIEQKPPDAGVAEFDQEFAQMNHVLTNYSPHVRVTGSSPESPSIEERIEAWIVKAEKGLVRLRRNRGKRLNEEFYNNKDRNGGHRAKRNGHDRQGAV